jgi:hypothetical protein
MLRNLCDKRESAKQKWIVGGKPFDPDETWEGAIERGVRRGVQLLEKKPRGKGENRMGNGGILAGVHKFIDRELGVSQVGTTSPHFRHLESCRQLSDKEIENFNGAAFVESIYRKLKENWTGGIGSDKNWRWEPRPTLTKGKDDKGHLGAEVPFERTIAILSEMRHFGLKDWTNQMPVASKLTNEPEGRRAIDLVHRCRDGVYDFIELKLPGDKSHETPLAAAIEVLIYGLLYVFSRVHLKELKYDSLEKEVLSDATKQINLLVVAPLRFYVDERSRDKRTYNLAWFQRSLNSGLSAVLQVTDPKLALRMSFQFEAIDDKFLQPDESIEHGFSLVFRPLPVFPQ